MPWGPSDASRFTKPADTFTRQKLWADTANRVLRERGDEGLAIRIANSAVLSQVRRGPRNKADRIKNAAQLRRLF